MRFTSHICSIYSRSLPKLYCTQIPHNLLDE